MKCPKCGYNSFENNDSCPKCFADVTAFKGTFGMTPLIFSKETRSKMADDLMTELASAVHSEENHGTENDMFSFDLPDDSPVVAATSTKDPFDFDDTPISSDLGIGEFSFDDQPATAQKDDPFASLLESTSQSDNDPFATLAAPATVAPEPTNSSPGEFDFNNFSWDDTPAPSADLVTKSVKSDLDSLFGELDDAAKTKK